MYREIIKVTSEDYMIKIPKEYLNQEVEILVFPFSYIKKEKTREFNMKTISPIMILQTSAMKRTWDNSEDEAWDAL